MNRIKILTITTSGFERKEGISTVIHDYYSKMNHQKFDLQILVDGEYDAKLVETFVANGVTAQYLPSRKQSSLLYYKQLAALLKKEKYDGIYVHGSSAIMAAELALAVIAGCKIRITHSHNTTCQHKVVDWLLRPIFYCLMTNAVACGNEAGKWLYGKKKFIVLKNARDVEQYRFDEATRVRIREQLGLKEQTIAIGHVGNFNAQKNQQFLLDVFYALLEQNVNAKLFYMGDGDTIQSVKDCAESMGIHDKVVFTGNISNIPEMLQAMDVMALPSLHEGLPLVVVEWQMAGLPCIVSDNVTNECVFTDFVTFKSLEEIPMEWAKQIVKMAERKPNRMEISRKAVAAASNAGFNLNLNVHVLEGILSGNSISKLSRHNE